MDKRDREHKFTVNTTDGDLGGWLRQGPPAAPSALLLHGGPGMSDYMAPLADELDGVVTTARYQQRGLPPSATGGDVSVEGQVADAVAVIRALQWDRPVVIGHSWGGYLAMHLGVAHPDEIGALVIIDALGPVDRGGQREFGPNLRRNLSAAALARLDELEKLDHPSQDEMREHLAIMWPNYFGDPASAPPMPHLEFADNNLATWQSIQRHFRRGTLARRLPAVALPTLVIHGERSPIPLRQARRLTSLMPNATLAVVERGGHWPWLERPGFVRGQVEALLERM